VIGDLMQSVFNRWNAAGLDESIAPLYPSGEGRLVSQNPGGAPEGSDLPRAEYFCSVGGAQAKSVSSRIYQGVALIQVWSEDSDSAGTYAGAVADAYINADEVGMTMPNGTILEVEDGGGFVHKEDDTVYLTQQTVIIRFRRPNTAPQS
jgi:hypothetical protein